MLFYLSILVFLFFFPCCFKPVQCLMAVAGATGHPWPTGRSSSVAGPVEPLQTGKSVVLLGAGLGLGETSQGIPPGNLPGKHSLDFSPAICTRKLLSGPPRPVLCNVEKFLPHLKKKSICRMDH